MQAYLVRVKGLDVRYVYIPDPRYLIPSFVLSAEYSQIPTAEFPPPVLDPKYDGLTQTDLNELLEFIVSHL